MARAVPSIGIADLAKRADLAVNTVSGFLNGKTWPQPAKLAAIEEALGLAAGTLDKVADGEVALPEGPPPLEVLPPDDEDGTSRMVVGFAPGILERLTPAQHEEAVAAAKLAALRAIREMTSSDAGAN